MIDLGVELLGYGEEDPEPVSAQQMYDASLDVTQRHIPVRIKPYSDQLEKALTSHHDRRRDRDLP